MSKWEITKLDRVVGPGGLLELTVNIPPEMRKPYGVASGYASIKVGEQWIFHHVDACERGITNRQAARMVQDKLDAYAVRLGDVRPILALLSAFSRGFRGAR